ncbi:kinase domain protein [Acinetobacter sp. WC-323]|uniref:serine/threonine-protein kinase n=1 Tax=Acinetobacter sp. WC-323 TaxID=903918 RepID=UPI00029E75E4|nr:serine/threonine-protein kinase [Acinetobacter sp. WC-323]EKU50891.1 kinase domain protein [Acinetobacter sp. WC-323]
MLYRGSYKIESIDDMGGGSFGVVQKVKVYNQKDYLCGIYAMKTMKSDAREIENFRNRFKREGHLQARCCHPNIVSIYICDLESPEPWFVMELGETDVEKLILGGNFPTAEKLECILHLLLGMSHIHQQHLLHRDIKPSNMVKVGSTYKIADFGLVKSTVSNPGSTPLTQIGQGMGTPGFMAPEAAFGVFNNFTDIYAIGTFIEYVCYNDAVLERKLSSIIHKCHEYMPAHRFQSINQILDAFMPIYQEMKNA